MITESGLSTPLLEAAQIGCPKQKMYYKKTNRAGSEAEYDPRTVGEILHEFLKKSDAPFAVASREHMAGFYPNTELAIDLKLLTRKPGRMRVGTNLEGVITHDGPDHYKFVETQPTTDGRRNPHVFVGRYITVTRRDDGTLRINLRQIRVHADNIDSYALGVCDELREALRGLVGEDIE